MSEATLRRRLKDEEKENKNNRYYSKIFINLTFPKTFLRAYFISPSLSPSSLFRLKVGKDKQHLLKAYFTSLRFSPSSLFRVRRWVNISN